MKILVVQESDWIKRGPHNSHHLLERLSEKGHDVIVIDYEINWIDEKRHDLVSKRTEIKNHNKLRQGAKITIIRPGMVKITFFNYISLLYTHKKEIKKQIKEYKPDVVIVLGILNANLAIYESRKNNIPIIYFILDTLHTLVHEPLFRPVAKRIEINNYRHSDLVIAVNSALKDYTIKMGATEEKTILLPHGIEYSRFLRSAEERDAMRKKYGLKPDDVVLFFMGYLYDFSGLIRLAQHLRAESVKFPHMHLLIVGEGPIYEELVSIARDIPDRMTVLGWQPYNEIPSIISASDICILPSDINDTMKDIVPIKILEYMAGGKPVITTMLPGVMKEFNDDSGISYVDKPEGVLEKARQLVVSGMVSSQGQKARMSVKDRDWDKLSNEFETILLNEIKKGEMSRS